MSIYKVEVNVERYEFTGQSDKWSNSMYFSDKGYAENCVKGIIKSLREDYNDLEIDKEFDGRSFEATCCDGEKTVEIQIIEIYVENGNARWYHYI